MDKQALKALGYFMAANFQAVLLIGIAFELVSYLEENYSSPFPWNYVVWPICLILIGHLYYLIVRLLIESERKRKNK